MEHSAKKKQGRLLIVDDEAELRDVLVSLLEDYVQDIMQASNGLEAMTILSERCFDAILCDERMPLKSGIEVLRWLRKKGLETPFIVHSGFRNHEAAAEATRLGVFAFVDKPWDEHKLIQTVCDAIETGLTKKN